MDLYRQMPQSIEAEQSVIGSMLIDSNCIPHILELLTEDDFYISENRNIFRTIYSMFTASIKIDPVILLSEIEKQGILDAAGGKKYILELMEVTPSSANVLSYVAIIRDKSMQRQVAQAADAISKLAYEGLGTGNEIAEIAEQKIYAIRHGREIKGLSHIKNVIMDLYTRLDELAKSDSKIPGVPTGFGDLDYFLTGLNKSDLILVAARPGMGKTSFALNIALNAAKKIEKDIVIFQLEMSKEQLAGKFLASEALIDSRKLKTGELDDEDWIKIAKATNTLSKTKIYIDDNPAITVAEIKAKCRRLGDSLGMIVIDYLQLMQSGLKRGDSRVNEVSEISRSLKIMAKELNVPVVCLSQLSRAAEQRQDKRPMLSDLRESGAIEQDADIVLFLYRDDYYNEESEEKNVAEIIISKNRHGSTGTIKLQWIGQYTIFANQEKQYDR